MAIKNSLYLSQNIRDMEVLAQAELPPFTLMHRAGNAIVKYITQQLTPKSNILLLVGPGNNGGDALEAASMLAEKYRLIILYDRNKEFSGDALQAFEHAKQTSATFIDYHQYISLSEVKFDMVIDGLFGIGIQRPIAGIVHEIIDYINMHVTCPVVAIDIPSGLNADTGTIVGSRSNQGTAIKASTTITFIGNKPGLHTCDGIDLSGNVIVETLDIPENLFSATPFLLIQKKLLHPYFLPRHANTHKGSFGDVVIIGGHRGTAGAAILAGRSALHAGAGRVFVSYEELPFAYDPCQPELMIRDRNFPIDGKDVVVIGPGLGVSDEAAQTLSSILSLPNQLVLDADALNLISENEEISRLLLNKHRPPIIITPHPLEAARLLKTNVEHIQSNRVFAAQKLAEMYNVHVILKGAGTVIATPNAYCTINTTGNPGLATAGTGDILAGLCGALLAQKIPMEIVAVAAPWIHGKAADLLVKKGIGPIGITATDLLPSIRKAINSFNN